MGTFHTFPLHTCGVSGVEPKIAYIAFAVPQFQQAPNLSANPLITLYTLPVSCGTLLAGFEIIDDFAIYVWLCVKPSRKVAAENLFLRMLPAIFRVVVTVNFRVLCAFVLIEHGSRRLIHSNVTANPTADWARQQIREAIPSDHQYRFLLHDRDCILSADFDKTIANFGIRPIRTPRQSPKANAICERVIGTLRRECLDYVIPMSERHLRRIMRLWTAHYNQSRPHSAIGPDIPSRVAARHSGVKLIHRKIKPNDRIIARPIFSGLHHDYQILAA